MLICTHAYLCVCVCVCARLCVFIFGLSTLILKSHSWCFVGVAIRTEISRAVSQEECFFINRSHEKFRYVRYTLCVIISSEICDRFLLKDHTKFLWAKEPLYKPKQQLLSDFLCAHLTVPIYVQCFFTSKTLNELLPEWKVSTFIFMLHPSKASLSYSEIRKAANWEGKQEGVPDTEGSPWTGQEMEQLLWAYAKHLYLLFPLKAISIVG